MPQLIDKPQDIGVIVSLIGRVGTRVPQLGKTQFQKLIYFLQETGTPLGFKYEIYHYGPYSFDLSNSMDTLDTLGVIEISTDADGYGFHISPGPFAKNYDAPSKYAGSIDSLLKRLGSLSASNLEVKATLHFVNKVLQKKGKTDRDSVVEKVQALKPRFERAFIETCYDELLQGELI